MFFPSFFTFCLWGTFADKNKQLPILLIDYAKNKFVKTQAEQRAAKRQKKTDERSNDTTTSRGFAMDQRISIESMNINKKRLEHQQNEIRLVGLSIQEAAIRN